MAAKRKDFIGFIVDAESDVQLATQFFSRITAQELHKFFSDKGYTEIKEQPDCEQILKGRNGLLGVSFAKGPFDCPERGY